MNEDEYKLISLTAEIVSAHVAHNTVAVSDLSTLIASVHASLVGLDKPAQISNQQPAVSVRASIKPDHLVCLGDGKRMKLLKRHLLTDHQITPGEYRSKWKLPADYPMAAPDYAKSRRTMALQIGLGTANSRPVRKLHPRHGLPRSSRSQNRSQLPTRHRLRRGRGSRV